MSLLMGIMKEMIKKDANLLWDIECKLKLGLNDIENIKEGYDFKIVKELAPIVFGSEEKGHEFLVGYVEGLDRDCDDVRVGLEYLFFNKEYDKGLVVLDRLKTSSVESNREWAYVYNIEYMMINGQLSLREAERKLNGLRIKTKEMSVFRDMLKMYVAYDASRYDALAYIFKSDLAEDIFRLEDYMLMNMYNVRYLTLGMIHYVFKGEEVEGELFGKEILLMDTKNGIYSFANHMLGKMYTTTDYRKAKDHLDKALVQCEGYEAKEENVRASSMFLDLYWGDQLGNVCEYDLDFGLLADHERMLDVYKEIKNGNNSRVEYLFDKLDFNGMDDEGKAYYHFYMGEWTKDEDEYFKSVMFFNRIGDALGKKMPVRRLVELGVKAEIIGAIEN